MPALSDSLLVESGENKSTQVSRTLLSIQVDLNNAVVWMILIRPLISISSVFLYKPLRTVPVCFFIIIIIIIIIIIYSLELFTSALADGFSLESEWQQVPSSLQDSS